MLCLSAALVKNVSIQRLHVQNNNKLSQQQAVTKPHLRHPLRRHPGLVVEDPSKVVSVGEHVSLSG